MNALPIPADYGERRGLAPQAETRELVEIGPSPDGRPIQLSPSAAGAWRAMRDDAGRDGITLVPISGFRSIARQGQIIEEKLRRGESIDSILGTIAAPGFSEHHTGRAIDISVPGEDELNERFAETAAFRWLEANASRFGFSMSYPRGNSQGFNYEPWHWCHFKSS